MSRSPYATTSALSVACPPHARNAESGFLESCGAAIGEGCKRTDGTTRFLVHSARRCAADAQRTQEVNPKVRET